MVMECLKRSRGAGAGQTLCCEGLQGGQDTLGLLGGVLEIEQ
jgi:hypothetical protein